MKTKVQVQRTISGGYEHLVVQILQAHKYSPNYLSPIGHISWQGDPTHQWYSMHFHIEADLSDNHRLLAMYKLSCYIKERITQETPVEVMAIIGGEQHFYDFGQYISVLDNGKLMYDVKKKGKEDVYTRVLAANEIMASRAIQGRISRKELNDEDYDIIPTGRRMMFTPISLDFATTR